MGKKWVGKYYNFFVFLDLKGALLTKHAKAVLTDWNQSFPHIPHSLPKGPQKEKKKKKADLFQCLLTHLIGYQKFLSPFGPYHFRLG